MCKQLQLDYICHKQMNSNPKFIFGDINHPAFMKLRVSVNQLFGESIKGKN